MSRKVIISCAVTGAGNTLDKHPAIPVTPKEIAQAAIDAHKAGAAIAHIHVRDPGTGGRSRDPKLFREVVERVRDSGSGVILNLTSGEGSRYVPGPTDPLKPGEGTTLVSPELRMTHILEMRPEMCTLDVGSMNFGDAVFMNTTTHLRQLVALIRESGAKPELEMFEMGHIMLANRMIADGLIDGEPWMQLCLGINWGAPATAEAVLAMKGLLPANAKWAAFGIGRAEFSMVAQSVLLGGHVRVGLEDNLYIEKGVLTRDNAQLVEKAGKIINILGEDVATAAEARQMLGLAPR